MFRITSIHKRQFYAIFTQFIRIIILNRTINLPIGEYIRKVILPVLAVSVITFISGFYIMSIFSANNIRDIIFVSMSAVIICILSIASIGMTRNERSVSIKAVHKVINKFWHVRNDV